jgi:GTP pyrophosphokinase
VREYRRNGEKLWQYFQGSRDGTLWYYRSVVEILETCGDLNGLTEELQRTFGELERLASETS